MTKRTLKVMGALVFFGGTFVGFMISQYAVNIWFYRLGVLINFLGVAVGLYIWSGIRRD